MADQPEKRYSPFNGPQQGSPPVGGQPVQRRAGLVRGSDVVLAWDAAVEIATALQFYVRGWESENGQDDATPSRPSTGLLRDGGRIAAATVRMLPTEVLAVGLDRLNEGYGRPPS
jgi:hypothetical protein